MCAQEATENVREIQANLRTAERESRDANKTGALLRHVAICNIVLGGSQSQPKSGCEDVHGRLRTRVLESCVTASNEAGDARLYPGHAARRPAHFLQILCALVICFHTEPSVMPVPSHSSRHP